MPVFETGAFNHSATCPAASQVILEADLLQPDAAECSDRVEAITPPEN